MGRSAGRKLSSARKMSKGQPAARNERVPSSSDHVRQFLSGGSVQAITFDVGGTLIACRPSVGHIYAAVAAENGSPGICPAELNRCFGREWQRLGDFRHSRNEWAALVDATFGNLVPSPPSGTFFPVLYERFAQPGAWRLFRDVRPTLKALRARGFRLGVISNWDERLNPLLEKLELRQYFDAVTISCEVDAWKPSADIFGAAARALGLPRSHILHVGDSRTSDWLGAREAGFQSLLLRRGAKQLSTGEIGSLADLHLLIHQPRRGARG